MYEELIEKYKDWFFVYKKCDCGHFATQVIRDLFSYDNGLDRFSRDFEKFSSDYVEQSYKSIGYNEIDKTSLLLPGDILLADLWHNNHYGHSLVVLDNTYSITLMRIPMIVTTKNYLDCSKVFRLNK